MFVYTFQARWNWKMWSLDRRSLIEMCVCVYYAVNVKYIASASFII